VTLPFADSACAFQPKGQFGSGNATEPLEAGDDPATSGGRARTRAIRRVLVVEDNEDAADALRMFLELSEHEVQVAATAPEALQVAATWSPEIVLSDIGLPGDMDGYTLARALREVEGGTHMFLVALSGYGREQDKARAREAGFDAHLTKPVDIHALEALLAAPRGQV
jgi:CheY-like chemotaxis protein